VTVKKQTTFLIFGNFDEETNMTKKLGTMKRKKTCNPH